MIVIPAIDIKDGKVVRLVQGDFNKVTDYLLDPVEVAKEWEKQGAQRLHVVDLDGAKTGQLTNSGIIHDIANAVKIPVQVGGGIRNEMLVEMLLGSEVLRSMKVERVILGTSAALDKNNKEFQKIIEKWKDRVAVSIDCKEGFVALRGWTEKSTVKGLDLAKEMESIGVKRLIYTDIARDGMLTGPNFEGLKEILKAVKIPVIASGGVASIDDIKKLIKISAEHKNLEGVITGKAIYEGKLNFEEATKLC